jgi:hypothetical protein
MPVSSLRLERVIIYRVEILLLLFAFGVLFDTALGIGGTLETLPMAFAALVFFISGLLLVGLKGF